MKSSAGGELSSAIDIGKDRYLIQTEIGSKKNRSVTTRVYLRGRIIYAKDTDYHDFLESPDAEEKIRNLLEEQHASAIRLLKAEKRQEEKTPSAYLEKVRTLIEKNDEGQALTLVREALEQNPESPFLTSYYGYLISAVEKNFKDGVALCRRAIRTLDKKIPFGEEFFYPVLYLNLGKAYLAAGRKQNAIEAFRKGLSVDSDNREIRNILKKMGVRRRPPFPFLDRSNLLNRLTGMLVYRITRRR